MSSNNQILSNNNLNVNTSSKYFNRDIKEYREEKKLIKIYGVKHSKD